MDFKVQLAHKVSQGGKECKELQGDKELKAQQDLKV
jgi:hypothetical protein